ncbi:class I SAM-dependent methyltransferase [Thiospirillum jenense]|uniref:Class I SAM-dependent methyltransferase n=1 Tax=Thiospirillum jenense TaxID=1653858 RepID=A0A839HFE6_9GAMM|nr:methyltransferase domain-containing protein [Thiospirillum jenense]MBB1125729.1 class I SAM-dependent methyltransferase [Thiospirillum jenense]
MNRYSSDDQKWVEMNSKHTLFRTSLIQETYIKTIVNQFSQGTKLLEIACGSGITSVLLNDLGFNVHATDINRIFIQNLKEKYAGFERISFELLDVFNLDQFVDKGAFDCVIHQGFLEHFSDEDIQKILRKCSEVSKFSVIDLPNDKRKNKLQEYGDERFISVERWCQLFRTSGYEVLAINGRRFEGSLSKISDMLSDAEKAELGTSTTYLLLSKHFIPHKLHYGCGTVFLEDHLNVDLADDAKVICNHNESDNLTTFDNYYKRQFTSIDREKLGIEVDVKCDLNTIAGFETKFDEIKLIHVFEHVPKYARTNFIENLARCLSSPQATLLIAVPDNKAICKLYLESSSLEEELKYNSWIFGSQRNQYLHHFIGYSYEMLQNVLGSHFDNFQQLDNRNDYPAIWMTCNKKL